MLGIFRARPDGGARLEPIDKKQIGRELAIPPGAGADARDGDLVAVEVAASRSGYGLATARVKEKLGSLATERAVSLIAIHAHSIPHVFPAATVAEADAARPAKLASREDWRELPLITIDPADAKDHDDAVHAARDTDPKNPGGFVVSIAIADVAHYVRHGSALDREALVRGNSVYFPDRVVPMLPERISNDLCSLRPGEDRAALAVRIVVGADGRKRSHSFHRVLMRSAAKLSYVQAQAAVDGWPDDTTGPLLASILEPLYAAYRTVKRARDERAPLDLDLPERKIVLTAHNTVDRVMTPERLDAHRLIEEFMILANVAAAETLEKARVPLIYRVHDEPDPVRVNALREFLQSLDISLPKAGALRAEQFNRILVRVKGHDVEKLVNEVVLRTQAQAEYTAENYGHFGLNLRRYAHFTSPIRRYADLVVHRGLIRACKLGDGALAGPSRRCRAGRDRGANLGGRAPRDESGTRNLRPPARPFPRRPYRRHVRRPHLGRHPCRTVRQARRYRRRRVHSGAHHRRGVFPLSRGPACPHRRSQRRDVPPRRSRHRASGRSGAGRGRTAIRAAVRGPPYRRRPGASATRRERTAREHSAKRTVRGKKQRR